MATANQAIGKVFILYGKVKAVASDGTERVLGPNSVIYANERIVTEADGSVSIMLDGPPPAQIDLGRMSDVLLNEDVYAAAPPEVVKDVAADAEKIQEALEGQGEIELDATAAGGAAGTGGQDVVRFNLDGSEVTPESGAETTGVGFDTVDTLEGATGELAALEPPIEPSVVSADPPYLMLSVGKTQTEGTTSIITIKAPGDGVFAVPDVENINFSNLDGETGAEVYYNKGNGFGVTTTDEKPGDGGYVIDGTEALVFSMGGEAVSATIGFKHQKADSTILWEAYNQDGEQVAFGTVETNKHDANFSYTITSEDLDGNTFNYLVISEAEKMDSSQGKYGFNVTGITAVIEEGPEYYAYTLTVEAALNDLDGGSEVLGSVVIPGDTWESWGADIEITGTGVTYDPVTDSYLVDLGPEGGSVMLELFSSRELTDAEINEIYGTVTATETGEGDVTVVGDPAMTTSYALVELFGDDDNTLTGTDANELMKGDDGADTFVVGEGDDTILDYSFADDIVKIGVDFDDITVEDLGGGSAKILIQSGGETIGSVTLTDIGYSDGIDIATLVNIVDSDGNPIT